MLYSFLTNVCHELAVSMFILKQGTNLAKSLVITGGSESLLALTPTLCVVTSQSFYLMQHVCVCVRVFSCPIPFVFSELVKHRKWGRGLISSTEVLQHRDPPDMVSIPTVKIFCISFRFKGQPS